MLPGGGIRTGKAGVRQRGVRGHDEVAVHGLATKRCRRNALAYTTRAWVMGAIRKGKIKSVEG